MTDFSLRYNPFKIETAIKMNGKDVKESSKLNIADNTRLQEWIDELPERFRGACNSKEFSIEFEGTDLDYDDLEEIVKEANDNGFNISISRKKDLAIKPWDSIEKELKEVFRIIQKDSPIEELKSENIKNAFNDALSAECPVDIIATMSAGKSTLINALLSKKLMPSQQEACTAIITEVHDNDKDAFFATALDANGDEIKVISELTYDEMSQLNKDETVSDVLIKGNIPFVNSDEMSLVLVDTPGPNNSRNAEHKAATYRMIEKSSKSLVLYVLNATQIAVNDDSRLLTYVSENMKEGGKQSRDRFIFVVNKLDEFSKSEDDVSVALENVRKYLEDKGIINPIIYPVSAITALDIRTVIRDKNIYDSCDEDSQEIEDAVYRVRKICKNNKLHLEQYAPLSKKQKRDLEERLAAANEKAASDDTSVKSEGMKELALIHSGIVSLEEAIKTYMLKYARTAKIKTAVASFSNALDSSKAFLNIENEIASNEQELEQISEELLKIQEQINSKSSEKEFEAKIDKLDVSKEINKLADEKYKQMEQTVRKLIENMPKEMEKADAEAIINDLTKSADDLQSRFQMDLEDVINSQMRSTADELINEYKERIKLITSGEGIEIISLDDFILPDFNHKINSEKMITSATKRKKQKIGSHTEKKKKEKGTFKKWQFWYNFIPVKVEVADYEDQEYIDGKYLAQKFFAPIQSEMYNNANRAEEYAKEQCELIKADFKKMFKEFEKALAEKMAYLDEITKNRDAKDNIISESRNKLDWINGIQKRLDGILEL